MGFKYAEYMASDAWAQRRTGYWSAHARRCRGCSSEDRVELHHLRYDNVYAEPDEDLMPLCAGCHAYVHVAHRASGGPLAKATRLALRDMRKPPATEPKPVGHREPNLVLFPAEQKARLWRAQRQRKAQRRRLRSNRAPQPEGGSAAAV